MTSISKGYITDVAIAVTGSVDSGKSSTVGVLTTGVLDDGNGKARATVAKHQHEIDSGKTSDISTRSILVPSKNRAITLIDLCGHEKYLKTTTHGISGHFPDYAIVIIGGNRGVLEMTRQHFTLLQSNNIPIVVVVTRADITPQTQYDYNLDSIKKYCEKDWKLKVEFLNNYFDPAHESKEHQDSVLTKLNDNLKLIKGKQMCIPVITISNKTGYYIDTFKQFIMNLEPRQFWDRFDLADTAPDEFGKETSTDITKLETTCNNRIVRAFMMNMDKSIFPKFEALKGSVFYIDSAFSKEVGLVVSGINRGEKLKVGDTLYIGPCDGAKGFKEVRAKSFHNNVELSVDLKRVYPHIEKDVDELDHHHRGCIALATNKKDGLTRDNIKRGMILVNNLELTKKVCYRFHATVMIFNNPSTLKTGYCPTIHMGTIRQAARMTLDPKKNNDKEALKAKEFGYVTFKFKQYPEFVEPYTVFIFRSGGIHGIGVVVGIVPIDEDSDAKPDPIKRSGKRLLHKAMHAKPILAKPVVKPAPTTS